MLVQMLMLMQVMLGLQGTRSTTTAICRSTSRDSLKPRLISSQVLLMATQVTFATLTVNISGMTSEPQGLCSRRLSLEVTTHAGNTNNACAALAEDAYYALVKVVLLYLGNNSG